MSQTRTRHLCIHGHFYQPPREDPFTGQVPPEPGAEPFENFNEKITAECYRTNAALDNFSLISFDLGPTLATWLERHDQDTYRRIVEQERRHYQRHGVGNGLAQVYSHAIMPLATPREKRIQVAWGLADFRHRFGHKPAGIWLAETAADSATLATLADYGVGFTILSPWQAAEAVDPTEPYLVRLPDGRAITVVFYTGDLSGGVSFDPGLTADAASFGSQALARHVNQEKLTRGERQLILVATDGELYGHHQPLRQQFLAQTLRVSAPANGFAVSSVAQYLLSNPPRREVRLHEPSSWSCGHGVDRWSHGCACTEGDGHWKGALRRALANLAERLDAIYEREVVDLLRNPWAAEEQYVQVKLGALSQAAFWRRQARPAAPVEARPRVLGLLEALYHRHLMFASCAFFFEDLARIEPRNAIAQGFRALRGAPAGYRSELEATFAADLSLARSWRTGQSGADLLQELRDQHPSAADLVDVA